MRAPIQFRRECQPQHLKDGFSSRTDPTIFTSIGLVLLDQSNEGSSILKNHVILNAGANKNVDKIKLQHNIFWRDF